MADMVHAEESLYVGGVRYRPLLSELKLRIPSRVSLQTDQALQQIDQYSKASPKGCPR